MPRGRSVSRSEGLEAVVSRRSRSRSRVSAKEEQPTTTTPRRRSVGPQATKPVTHPRLFWGKILKADVPIAPISAPPEVYYPPSGEMLFFQQVLGWLLNPAKPHFVSRVLQYLFVAPYTNVTSFSLFYQMYLNQLVHRVFWTQLGHHLCTPVIIMFMWTCFAQFKYNTWTHASSPGFSFTVDGADLWFMYFFAWYTIWGFIGPKAEKVPLLSLISLPSNLVILKVAHLWDGKFGIPFAERTGTCFISQSFCPTANWYTNPFILFFVMSFVQGMSHAFEIALPPRTTRFNWWVNIKQFIVPGLPPLTLIFRLLGMAGNALWGMIDELLVTPRLHPIHNLFYVTKLTGYKKDQLAQLYALVDKSIDPASGNNAALDYIGVGGGAYLWQAKQVDGSRYPPGPLHVDLSGRRFDWFYVGALSVMLAIAWLVEFMPAFGPINQHNMTVWNEYAKEAIWPPAIMWKAYFWWGENVDPLYVINPLYMKITSAFSPIVYSLYYPFGIYAFVMGKNWIKIPTLLWASSAWSFAVFCYLQEIFDPVSPALNFWVMTASYSIYLIVPIMIIFRVAKPKPFPNDPAVY